MKGPGGGILSWVGFRESEEGQKSSCLCWWPSGLCCYCCVDGGLETRQNGVCIKNCECRKVSAEDASKMQSCPWQPFISKMYSSVPEVRSCLLCSFDTVLSKWPATD